MTQSLLIFAKNLVHGQVKTRIAATMGEENALTIYQKLLAHTKEVTTTLPLAKTVFYSTFIEEEDIWKNTCYKKKLQYGSNLGDRMLNAFKYAFEQQNDEVAIIGTDCFDISSDIIMKAFTLLKTYDVVIGPAKDGGYYLLAIKQLHQPLFEHIPWSTNDVLNKTMDICAQLQLTVYLLQELTDVDTENDLTEEQKLMWLKKSG